MIKLKIEGPTEEEIQEEIMRMKAEEKLFIHDFVLNYRKYGYEHVCSTNFNQWRDSLLKVEKTKQ